MTAPHPYYDAATAWRDLVIAGPKDRIDQFVLHIDQHLPDGWAANPQAERQAAGRGFSVPMSRCYLRRLADPDREVWLWLHRPGNCRVQGGLVEPTKRDRYEDDVADAITDFRRRVMEPAAAAAGLRVGRRRIGPLSSVSTATLDAIWSFFEITDFGWPPAGFASEAWREFVRRAYTDESGFDPEEFRDWLTGFGWSAETAAAIEGQLGADLALVHAYAGTGSPA